MGSLVVPEKFQHILRCMNTNIDGKRKIPFAITAIRGVGRRFAFVVCKKANVDPKKRAGELTSPLLGVNIGLLAHNKGKSASNTPDGGYGKGNFDFPIDVRVHNTKNVLKLLWHNKRHFDALREKAPC